MSNREQDWSRLEPPTGAYPDPCAARIEQLQEVLRSETPRTIDADRFLEWLDVLIAARDDGLHGATTLKTVRAHVLQMIGE